MGGGMGGLLREVVDVVRRVALTVALFGVLLFFAYMIVHTLKPLDTPEMVTRVGVLGLEVAFIFGGLGLVLWAFGKLW